MEEAQRLEIAARIRELRETSPYSQPAIAEKLGIGLRAYQKLESRGTTRWERCVELAEIHNAHLPDDRKITPEWIWSGRARAPTPDVLAALDDTDQLDRIEDKLDWLIASEVADRARSGLASEAAARAAQKAARQSPPAPRQRRDQASG